MKNYIITLYLVLLTPCALIAQKENEIFHELGVDYSYLSNENWRGNVAASWKYIYNDIGWRRWSGSGSISRKLKNIGLEAGILSAYTFDKNIVNYLELRPWLGIYYNYQLGNRLLLAQKFKTESRTFLYEDSYPNEHRLRYRFLMSLSYEFIKGRKDWKLNPTGEWYILGKNADAERFSNSIEFGLKVIKILNNSHKIAFAYKQEYYKLDDISDDKRGHVFILEYSF